MRDTLDKYTQCAFVNADYDCRRPAQREGKKDIEKKCSGNQQSRIENWPREASTLWTGNAGRANERKHA